MYTEHFIQVSSNRISGCNTRIIDHTKDDHLETVYDLDELL